MHHLKLLIRGAIVASFLALIALVLPSTMGTIKYIYPRDDAGKPLYDSQGNVLRTLNPLWTQCYQTAYEWSLLFLSITLVCLLVAEFKCKKSGAKNGGEAGTGTINDPK